MNLLLYLLIGCISAPVCAGRTFIRQSSLTSLATAPLTYSSYTHTDNEAALLDGGLRITPFLEHTESRDIGRALGYAPEDADYTFAAINSLAVVKTHQADAVNNYFVHAQPGQTNTRATIIDSTPSRTAGGVLASFEQYLPLPLIGGWYLGLQSSYQKVSTDVGITHSQAPNTSVGELLHYFSGAYSSDTPGRQQSQLTTLIFDEHSYSRSAIPDLTLSLRSHLIKRTRLAVDYRVTLTAPLIAPPPNKRLFEAQLGSNGHWVSAMDLSSTIIVRKTARTCFGVTLRAHAGYTWGRRANRTIPFKPGTLQHPLGHYALLVPHDLPSDSPLVPGTTPLTRACHTTPGWNQELTGLLVYTSGAWQITAGYTYQHAAAEQVNPEKRSENYSLAGSAYDTRVSFAAQKDTPDALAHIETEDGSTHTTIIDSDLSFPHAGSPATHAHFGWAQVTYALRTLGHTTTAHCGVGALLDGSAHSGHPIGGWLSIKVRI